MTALPVAGGTVELGKMPAARSPRHGDAMAVTKRALLAGELERGQCGRRARNEREYRGRKSRTNYVVVKPRDDHGMRWPIEQQRGKRQKGASIGRRRIGVVILGVFGRGRKYACRRRRHELRRAAGTREVIVVMREGIGLMFAGGCTERQQQDAHAKQPERPDGPDSKRKHLAS
jgi:hypothetical protein